MQNSYERERSSPMKTKWVWYGWVSRHKDIESLAKKAKARYELNAKQIKVKHEQGGYAIYIAPLTIVG